MIVKGCVCTQVCFCYTAIPYREVPLYWTGSDTNVEKLEFYLHGYKLLQVFFIAQSSSLYLSDQWNDLDDTEKSLFFCLYIEIFSKMKMSSPLLNNVQGSRFLFELLICGIFPKELF